MSPPKSNEENSRPLPPPTSSLPQSNANAAPLEGDELLDQVMQVVDEHRQRPLPPRWRKKGHRRRHSHDGR